MVMLATPPPSLEWERISRDVWRAAGSRFEVHDTRLGYFVAYDADAGRTFRSPYRFVCEAWCQVRAAGAAA